MSRIVSSVSVEPEPTPSVDIGYYLMSSIVSQQLSTKVADIIWKRFTELFKDEYPDPKAVLETSGDALRNIGLSRQKSKYLKNVAQFALENDMRFEILNAMSDEEIIHSLTSISGVGKWTVQMVLMFPMDRPDVFPVDDLGIQTKMKHWYGLTTEKKELKQDMQEIAEVWKPYRTLACKYLWSSLTD